MEMQIIIRMGRPFLPEKLWTMSMRQIELTKRWQDCNRGYFFTVWGENLKNQYGLIYIHTKQTHYYVKVLCVLFGCVTQPVWTNSKDIKPQLSFHHPSNIPALRTPSFHIFRPPPSSTGRQWWGEPDWTELTEQRSASTQSTWCRRWWAACWGRW